MQKGVLNSKPYKDYTTIIEEIINIITESKINTLLASYCNAPLIIDKFIVVSGARTYTSLIITIFLSIKP